MTAPTPEPEAAKTDAKAGVDRFRFRVRRVSDGSELIGPVLELPQGLGRLGTPAFLSEGLGHGDWVEVLVAAPGLDGRKVRFKLEARTGEQFVPYEEAIGEVARGWATAKFQLQHPEHKGKEPEAAAQEGAGPSQLRLSAELV